MPHAQTRWVHPVRPGEVGGLTQGVGGYPDGRRWDAHMLQSAGIAPAPRQGRQSSERECEPMTVGISNVLSSSRPGEVALANEHALG